MERTDANPNPPSGRLNAQEFGAAYPSSSAGAESWATGDSALIRAVLAKTEEGLLEALAALMRNKADIERTARRLTQLVEETSEARRELDRVRSKDRQAEDDRAVHQGETVRLREQNPGAPDRASGQEPGYDEPGPEWEPLQEERERLSAELEQLRATYFAYQVESNRSRESLEEEIGLLRQELARRHPPAETARSSQPGEGGSTTGKAGQGHDALKSKLFKTGAAQ